MKFFQTVCYSLSCRDQVSRSTYQEPTVYIQHYNMHANSNFFEEKVTETKPLPCRNKYYHFKSKIDCFAIKTFCRQSHVHLLVTHALITLKMADDFIYDSEYMKIHIFELRKK